MNEVECKCDSSMESLTEDEREKMTIMIDWVQTDDFLKDRKIEWDFIANCLAGCKFDVEKAKIKIVRYYRARINYSVWFNNRDVAHEKIMDLVNRGVFYGLKQRDSLGRPVAIFKCSNVDPKLYNINDIIKMLIIVQDTYLLGDFDRINGSVWVADCDRMPMSFIMQCTPSLIYRFVDVIMMSMPMQLKEINLVNVNVFTMTIINLFRMFLTSKLRQRIHILGKGSLLFDEVQLDCLPIEFGGQGGTIQENIDFFREKLLSVRERFLTNEQTFHPSQS